jgi:hypothetical protein
MRILYLLLCIVLLSVCSYAQGRIGYSYDASGNRVKREIIMPVPKAMAKQQGSLSDNRSFSDILSGHSIRLYPGSTAETLKICVTGLKRTDMCSLEVYTLQGAQILSENVTTDKLDVDISDQPSGVYLFKIIINGESNTWKIIKK